MLKPIIPFTNSIKRYYYTREFQYEIEHKSEKISLTQITPLSIGSAVEKNDSGYFPIYKNKSVLIFSGSLGNLIVDFLNNYQNIVTCLKESKFKISNCSLKDEDNFENILTIEAVKTLSDELEKIFPNSYILLSTIFLDFFFYIDFEIVDYQKQLLKLINDCSRVSSPIDEFGVSQWDVEKYKKHYEEITSTKFFQSECLEFVDRLISKLSKLNEKIKNSFIYGKGHTKFYSGEELQLPFCKVFFNNNTHPSPKKYLYKFHNPLNLVDIDLYHISLMKKSIKQCKNCNKFFVTLNNNSTEYCSNVFNEKGQTCKEIGASLKFDNNTAENRPYYKLYEAIYNRLYNSDKYRKSNLENFMKTFNKLKQEGKSDIELWIWLTEYDKNFQKEHPVKKGRPYSSNKHWFKEKKVD